MAVIVTGWQAQKRSAITKQQHTVSVSKRFNLRGRIGKSENQVNKTGNQLAIVTVRERSPAHTLAKADKARERERVIELL